MKIRFMNSIDKLIENLNKEQKDAVLSTEGPNLIVAGAGSGKTFSFNNKTNTYYKSKKSMAKSNFMCDFYK